MIDVLAALDASQDLSLFVMQFGRNNDGDRLSNRFLGSKAEDTFGAGVPAGYKSIQIFGNDSVIGRLNNGSKAGSPFESSVSLDRLPDIGLVVPRSRDARIQVNLTPAYFLQR